MVTVTGPVVLATLVIVVKVVPGGVMVKPLKVVVPIVVVVVVPVVLAYIKVL